jgi:CHAT domain-containing protein/Tfp pilus assembly protein PilF
MSMNNKEDNKLLRRYLLGQLGPDEESRIEDRLLFDDDYMELLLVVEDEIIESYIGGALPAREMKWVEKNFFRAPERIRKLRFAKILERYNSTTQEEEPGFLNRARQWFSLWRPSYVFVSATSTLLLTVAGVAVWWAFFHQTDLDKGMVALNAAYRDERPVKARISGLAYAPYIERRGDEKKQVDQRALNRAERIFLDLTETRPKPDSLHALGRYYLAKKDLPQAIELFETALKTDPNNAELQSDLGAALLEQGRADRSNEASGKSLEDFAKGLERFNKALELNSGLLEALFNRALCRQYMMLPRQAEEDWRNYLEKDSSSRWAIEARENLKAIEEQKNEEQKKKVSQSKEEVLQEFLHAYRAKDDEKAWRLIRQNREATAGRLIWWRLLDDFFNLTGSRQPDQAYDRLQALFYVGELEYQRARDPYVLELARYYHASSPSVCRFLAQAHVLINQGHDLYVMTKYNHALDLYNQAREIFARFGNELETKLADFFRGYCLFQLDQKEQQLSLFEILAGNCRNRNYLWLLSQTFNSLSNVEYSLTEYSKGLGYANLALNISEKIDDPYSAQKNLAQLAYQYRNIGDYDKSLSFLNKCLVQAGKDWPGARQMWRTYVSISESLSAARLYASAASYEKEALRLAQEVIRDPSDPSLIYVSYMNLALTFGKQQNFSEAINLANRGFEAAKKIDSEQARLSSLAYASLQLGHLLRQTGDYNKALAYYDQSVELHDAVHSKVWLYDAHKGRLLCHFAQGNDAAAKAELQTTLRFLENNRDKILEEDNRNTYFDVEQSIYDAAADFAYSRLRDNRAAFEYIEVSRARSLWDLINAEPKIRDKNGERQPILRPGAQSLTLTEVQQQMPDQAILLQYAALDDKLLICAISKDKFSVVEKKIRPSELADKVFQFNSSISRIRSESVTREAKELYDLLIAPIESLLEKGKTICIAPDKALSQLPYDALVSPRSGRYLIEDYQLTFSPSATVYIDCSNRALNNERIDDERLLIVDNPSFDHRAFPSLPDLPSAAEEAEKVAGNYPTSRMRLSGAEARKEKVQREMERSDVIHIASHYVADEQHPMRSKLLLAREPGQSDQSHEPSGTLQAYEIYRRKLPRARLVVLSACQTGVERYYNGEGMIGMSRVFLAAGVPLVVASLWPVDSSATKELMVRFHEYRRSQRLSTAAALRKAQLDLLGDSQRNYQQPYYWTGFIAIGGQTNY